MPTRYDRRSFLVRSGAAGVAGAAAPLLVRSAAAASPDPALAPFHHGVASGDPLPDGVVIWTRVTPPAPDARVPVRWVVARDVGLGDVVQSGVVEATPERDHTVKVDVAGLAPGAWWFYRFEALGRASITGRTKTAPAGPVPRLRFALLACSDYQHGFFNAYGLLAQRHDIDAVFHVGDYIYEYAPGEYGADPEDLAAPRDHEPPVETVELAHYRVRYGQYRLDPDLRRLHQLFPFIVTWDDHESTNDAWRDGAQNHQPDEGDWATRKAVAQQVYDEWMPTRVAGPARIYRSLRYGDLVDIVVLDTRLEGRDQQVGRLGATALDAAVRDPGRQLVSADQRGFWFGELTASAARGTRWRLVVQQVMMAPLNLAGLPHAERLLGVDGPDFPLFLTTGPANALNPDQWDGYVAERERFYRHLASGGAGEAGIGNVVVLTGDLHSSWAADLSPDPYNPTVAPLAVEFVTTSVTSAGLDEILGSQQAAELAGVLVTSPASNPHIKYAELTRHGYTLLDVTPERVQAEWWYVDTVLAPSRGESFGAAWKVDDGANRLSRAQGPSGPGQAAPATPPAAAEQLPPALAGALPGGAGAAEAAGGGPDAVVRGQVAGRLPETGAGSALGVGTALLAAAAAAAALRRRAERAAGGGEPAEPADPAAGG